MGGNYWSDYNGVDTDGDGLGDTMLPYNCNGGIISGGDYLPLTSPNYAPIAKFDFTPRYPTTNDIIQFTDSSYDVDGTIVNWTWDFGDGSISYEQNPQHQYADNGTYTVTLTVRDNDGATNSISQQITVGYISFTLHLTKGWNFITIPVNAGLTAKSLGENITGCTTISRWNNSRGMFESYLPGISPIEDDFPIENGIGYFIYVNENVAFNVTGTPITSVDIILPEGWNTIGWYKDVPTTASEIAENITGCTTISRWNNSRGMFESYLPGISPVEDNFVIRKGTGIFVYVREESRWICN